MRNTRPQALAALLCALVAFAASPAARAQASTDTSYGTWPFLVGNMDPQIATLVSQASSHGLDTIYVNVFRTTGPQAGTLWVDDTSGTWNPAWGPVRTNGVGIDLAALIRAAHAQNIQVVGVVKCFDDTVQPTNAGHRAYLLQVCDYLMNRFDGAGRPYLDMDGLALDYIRWVGASCSNDPAVINDLLRDIRGVLGTRSLHAYVLANRYTFDGPVYNGQFNSYSSVIGSLAGCYGQHWEQMARYVDVMMPMAYTANGSIYSTYALHQAYVQQVAAYCRLAAQRGGFPATRVVPAIRCYNDSNETATPQTIDASITGALAGGGDGYHAFRYGTTQASWWPVLAQYAAPAADRPIPDLTANVQSLTAMADAGQSLSATQAASALDVRFDLGNDGTFETGWMPNQATPLLLSGPGSTRVGVQVRDAQGHVGSSVRAIRGIGPLVSDPVISATAGGSVSLTIDAGVAAAGKTYLVTGSLAGSTPGVPVGGGLTLPLNPDALTAGLIASLNTPVLANSFATLDAQGRATATFTVPGQVLGTLLFRTITWAGIGADALGRPVFVTNASLTVISL